MRDESVPPPNKMYQDIASAISRELFPQQAPAHIRMLDARSNANGMITALTRQNATAEMALRYHDSVITAGRTVKNSVIDVEENVL